MEDSDYFDTVFQTKDMVRLALLVGYADGTLDAEELTKAHAIFADIADEFLHEHDGMDLSGQVDRIAEQLREEVKGLDADDIELLVMETADEIEGPTWQEVSLIAAIRVAMGDHELAKRESRCIQELAKKWEISLNKLV